MIPYVVLSVYKMIDLEKTIQEFAQKEICITILKNIKSGKEATVFKVLWNEKPY
ncbi:MAG: hypothetical protein WCJ19_05725 [bacterium]